jgi:protein-S-isoprenylcysteine O-methyltransferase Ste14
MSDRAIGWLFVAVQVVLLGVLIFLPGSDDWPTPQWLRTLGTVVNVLGFALLIVAALGLGSSLTAIPVPKKSGKLETGGLYRFVRHPIYTGVFMIVVALVATSGSWLHLAIGVVTMAFFSVKARWEEQRLRLEYPEYDAYARATGRFVPVAFRHKSS